MSWFRQNRFLGAFVVAFGVALLASLVFLWFARSSYSDAQAHFTESATELNRLQHLTPFPNDVNLRKVKAQAEEYAGQLDKAKEEMRAHVLPVVPMAPNEFQIRLRQAMASVAQRARDNRVRLPDNFNLGFDEYVAALPDTAAAPVLGQQLAQVELLVNLLIDARIDALTSLRRVAPPVARAGATPTPAASASPAKPGASPGAQSVERASVDATFVSSPAAARRALNQITTVNQQFYVIRTLHVLNEKDKGPPRDVAAAGGASAAAAPATPAATPSNTALTFIVGNEHIQTTARIEMLRFSFAP